jgi:biotin transport system substrate-specific component
MTKLNHWIKIAAMTAVLCTSVYLVPPIVVFGGVPLTIQTFVIFLIAYLFNKTDAFLTIALYLLIGLLGLPVFSGGTSGLSAILGPTGGFLVMFPVVAYLISSFKSNDKNPLYDILITVGFGIVLLYGFSAVWLAYVLNISYLKAILILLPFVPLDIFKIVIAHTVYQKMPSIYELSTH